jgi:glycine/D-amino acid oxidase-like deaminating enzyme
VGLVNAGLWKPPDQVLATLGQAHGERMNTILSQGPAVVFELIERHQITCEATRNGTLHCAHNARGWRDLQNRYRQQVARGAPVMLLSAEQAAQRTGSTRFHGALWDGRAGTIQPLSFATGLAGAARAAGANLYEHSAAESVQFHDGHWKIQTLAGEIRSRRLIQATNAYGAGGLAQNAYIPVHYFQLATDPLPDDLRAAILPGGEGCWDTAQIMSSFRLDKFGRLIIGAIGNLDGFGAGSHRHWARRKLARLYPQLAGVDMPHSWTGQIAMTEDYLPKVVDIGPKAISIYGFSGRGIGPGTLFGKCAVDWVIKDDDSAFPVPITPATHARFRTAKALYFEAGASLTHLLNSRIP